MNEINETIFKLYLYMVSTKKIHYTTQTGHMHELCDKLFDEIKEFADTFAEQLYGYYGKPKYTSYKNLDKIKIQEADNIPDTCKNIINLINFEKNKIKKDKKLDSIISLIDDFLGQLNQIIFLSTFDKVANYKK